MTLPLSAWALPLGAALDALIGDPRGWPHPVRGIGWMVSTGDRWLRRPGLGPIGLRCTGAILAVCVIVATGGLAWGFATICDRFGPIPSLVGRALIVHFGLATRSLRDEVRLASECLTWRRPAASSP